MGTLQFRLFVTYLFIIVVTLGLAALSLFLLLGGYRNSISYTNLEDVGALLDRQAQYEIESALGDDDAPEPEGSYLLIILQQFIGNAKTDAEGSTGTAVGIIDRENRILDASGRFPLKGAVVEDIPLAPDQPIPGGGREPERCTVQVPGGPRLLCVSVRMSPRVLEAFPGTEASALIVAQPAASLNEVLSALMPRLVFSGLIGVAAALVLGFLLSQSVAAPLRNIARAARSVARGNYLQRVPATGPREVRDLAANFNRMTEEVQRSQQLLRDFLANISHELKTPLTSIRGFSQAMVDGTVDDRPGVERSARIINTESNRVLRLVEELLDLSRIESGQASMRQDDVGISELFDHVAEVFALRAEDTGVNLVVSANNGARIRGDFDRLEQVLNNLLDNAFRHTPSGGTVRLGSEPASGGGFHRISVADSGAGITRDDIPHLFERFYRGVGRSGNGKGYGLGLAITREIIRAHGGDIWAQSEPGRGTVFTFTLPSAAPTAGRASSR
ncbi:MAG: sensor histidine kinase [Dehalococcoidia bacterium]